MSTLKVNTIQHSNGTNAMTIDSSGNAAFSGVVTGTPLGNRNLIINGDMRIWQRGTSALAKTSNSYLADRFLNNLGNLNGSAYNMTQDTDVPAGQGFPYSIKLQPSTALSSPVSNTFVSIVQNIESQNVNHLSYGTANAKTITLSFWIKSNITGIVPGGIFQSGVHAGTARSYPFTYNIDSADTWEKKTIVITGDSNGALPISNTLGFELNLFYMAIGSDFQNGTENSWNANSVGTEYIASGYSFINRANSTSNYVKVTGVQLEVGENATEFEHRPYDMELQRCIRYFRRVGDGMIGKASSATVVYYSHHFEIPMRSTPTMSLDAGTSIRFGNMYSADYVATSPSLTLPRASNVSVVGQIQGFSGMTTADVLQAWQSAITNWLLCDAEL